MIVPNLLSLGVFEATVGSSASTSFAAFSFWIVVPLVGGIGLLCLDQVSVEFKRHIAGNSQIVAPSAGGSTQILPFLWIKSLRDESRCVKLDFDKEQRLSERFLFSSDTYGTLLHTHTCAGSVWLGSTPTHLLSGWMCVFYWWPACFDVVGFSFKLQRKQWRGRNIGTVRFYYSGLPRCKQCEY